MSFISRLKSSFIKSQKRTKFSVIEKEIFNGNYSKANTLLNEIDNNTNSPPSDLIQSQIYRSFVLINQSNPTKALELADKAIQSIQQDQNDVHFVEVILAKAYALYDLNKIPDCTNSLEQAKNIFKSLTMSDKEIGNEIEAKIRYLQGRVYRKQNDISNSVAELNKALELRKTSKNLDGLGDVYAELGILNFFSGLPEPAVSSLEEAIAIFKKLNNKNKLLKAYNNIGLIYNNLQNKDKSFEYYLLSIKLLEEFGDKYKPQLGILSLNIGLYYISKGELNQALNYLDNANKIFDEIGARDQKAYVLMGTASIYELKGDLKTALETFENALGIFEKLENKKEIGNTNNNIGNVHLIAGESNQAIPCYEKALTIAYELNDPVPICSPIYNLISIYSQKGDLDKANDYLAKMEKIAETNDNKLINQILRISKANILKTSKRIIKKAEAQLIYQQISFEDVVLMEVSIDAMFNLCDMLIQELRSSGNENIIKEVKDVVSKLIEIAQNQNSFFVLVQAKLLESKIALLELDLNTSKSVLNEAQQIAFEKGLDNLALVVSGEYDALIGQLSQWSELIDSNVSMIQRLEMAELEGLVSNMVRKKVDSAELLNETPELFLVMNDQGAKIFSRVFSAEANLDDQVVGDLLTAVNSFLQETFSASGSIERLKHKEHTLVLKPIANYLTCYVFKGQSYPALQKLEKFIDSLKSQQELYQNVLNTKENLVNDQFNSLVSDIFTAKAQTQ